ncbi:MAG: hypothetical protein KF708_06450 [Pirellulales bacterium]|nr:hypothetical protein [Pirellulales bacterium]
MLHSTRRPGTFGGRFLWLAVAAVAGATFGTPTAVTAQGNRGGTLVEVTRFTGIKGTFVAAKPGMIQWTDSNEIPYYVKVVPMTDVQVLGEAEPGFLRPGQLVQFQGKIQGRGTVVEPIDELTVFTPRDGYNIGVFKADENDKRDDGPKLIAGQLRSIKNGKIVVVAGKQQIKAELIDEPQVKLDINDYSLAAPGDEIIISGIGFDQTKIEASGIEIQLSKKLPGIDAPKKPGRGSRPLDDARD